MGRRGLGHSRTYLKNEVPTSPQCQYAHLRRHSAATKSLELQQPPFSQRSGDSLQKKHLRHVSAAATTTQMPTEISPISSSRKCIEMPPDSGHLLVSQKLAQLYPRFMIGSACVSSKRRRYYRSKKARDQRNSPQQHRRFEESPCRETSDGGHSDYVNIPPLVVPDNTVTTDETETEGDNESPHRGILKIPSEKDKDEEEEEEEEEDCLLFTPEPVRFGQKPVFPTEEFTEEYEEAEPADEEDGEEEEEEEEAEEEEECPKLCMDKDISEVLPSPVLETILKHSDVCTRYALGYTCVRWNRIAINSGIEWCSYHHESVENLLLNEVEHPPVENYALIHPYITPMLRLAYADWLCNIARDTDQPPCVLPLAFRLFDRTLSSVERFPVQQLQALAAACFWIASKILGTESLMASDMCVFSGGLFDSQVICSLERFVMRAVNYRLMPPTTRDFLDMYLDNSTRLLSSGYIFTVDQADEAENLLCPSSAEFDNWAEEVRQSEGITVSVCMSFLETLSLHVYSLAPCQPSVLSAAIFSVSLAIVTGTAPLRSALVRYATHAFLIEDAAVSQLCSVLMNTCVMVQEMHECKFLRTAYPAFFPKSLYDEQQQ